MIDRIPAGRVGDAPAIGLSDHVMIPVQGCAMDARGAAQILELLKQLDEKAGIRIGHSVVLTRMNSMVTTRAMAAVKMLLSARGAWKAWDGHREICSMIAPWPNHAGEPRGRVSHEAHRHPSTSTGATDRKCENRR